MTKLNELANLGQSIWYDNIRRALLDSGELQALIDAGVVGITSNPSIFEKAIIGSADYDEALGELATEGKPAEGIYEALAIEDIQRAADLLRPVYDRTGRVDGYVSLEVSPKLAHDTDGTVASARRLFAALDRPNVMIKVPATAAGILAFETLIGEGININVTLIFSLAHYEAVADAYIAGLERLAAVGGDLSKVASVASFFVSRVDTVVDRALEATGSDKLLGKIAIANARAAYARFRQVFGGERWDRLATQGARVQRPLWASTGVKSLFYPDTMYVDALIGPDTVNTVPPATLTAFMDHGTASLTLESGIDEAQEQLDRLASLGVDLDAITQELQADGVAAFAASFESLLESVADKRNRLLGQWQRRSASLGVYQSLVDMALDEMVQERIIARIWAHDYTVWKPGPAEIANRLGWLHIADLMAAQIYRLQALVESVRADGYTDVLILGMGGSSLAPDVFGKVFAGQNAGFLNLAVLDSTDPGAILAQAARLDPARTLFIVSTKSGGTVETLSFFKYFYNWTARALRTSPDTDRIGAHFVAITDPGSRLATLADRYGFRATFLNDPNIGGRYSALSYFGLVPAALVGVDLETLLDQALTMACNCEPCNCPVDGDNNGAWLGAVLGELAKAGRDKVTLVTSPPLGNFGDWAEQLIAESTGKEGKGILPVVGEPLATPVDYGEDRLFVYLKLDGDGTHDLAMQAIKDAAYPIVQLCLRDLYDLGDQFFLWEMATAVAGHRLGINPFNQPNVEAAKVLGREAVTAYTQSGALPEDKPASLTAEALIGFLALAQAGDYISLHAYVQPTAETDAALLALRVRLRDRLKLATTVGYGPRFLHSTGQLHKGDRGNGLFIQFTTNDAQDAPIPDEQGSEASAMTFGVLKMAQALGDKRALQDAGRRVIRFHLGDDVIGGLMLLSEALA